MLAALKSFLKHRRKHVLQYFRLYGDLAWSPYIVVMVVSNFANMFLTLSQHFDYHIASFRGIVINRSVSSNCNDHSNHSRHVSSLVSSCITNLNQIDMAKQLLTYLRLIARMRFSLKRGCSFWVKNIRFPFLFCL